MTTLAVFGGSFDPPHLAHVLCACWARSVAPVDEVLIIPTFRHAFGKDTADFDHRARMCELAFAHLRDVHVSRVEADLGGESRTYHTLVELARRHPGALFRLVIGADILTQTERWFRWSDVVQLAPPLVVGRQGYPPPDNDCPVLLPEVSSSEIRRRLVSGGALEGYLPGAVIAYIEEHGLYS